MCNALVQPSASQQPRDTSARIGAFTIFHAAKPAALGGDANPAQQSSGVRHAACLRVSRADRPNVRATDLDAGNAPFATSACFRDGPDRTGPVVTKAVPNAP